MIYIKKWWLSALFIAILAGCTTSNLKEDYTQYVMPIVGTDSKYSFSHGNVYPAIARPWGMHFWTPQNGKNGDGWTYSYEKEYLLAFKQTHQPSPWINDYGAFSIMPALTEKSVAGKTRYSFSHQNEVSLPHYYKVKLDNGITSELTTTERAASFRITYPKDKTPYLVIDGYHGGSYIKILPKERKVIGYAKNNHGGVTSNFANYFVIEFPVAFKSYGIWNDTVYLKNETELKGEHISACIELDLEGEIVEVKTASSFINDEQAMLNLSREVGSKTFDMVKEEGQMAWNKPLSRISIKTDNIVDKKKFYTFYYRTLLFPRKLYEIDANGKKVHYSPYNGKTVAGVLYGDNGFWDTFRGVFPFFTLMFPNEEAEMLQGIMVSPYKESGFLPEWSSPGHRNCMVGSNSSSIIADAYLNGIRDFDYKTAYKGMLNSAYNEGPMESVGRYGIEWYTKLGYIPYDVGINENTARTLEYAYNDYCIWKMAKALGRPQKEIDEFGKRAMYYKNVFDKSVNFMRGRNKDGSFQTPFRADKWGDAFTEGCSWHWTWCVFHDPAGLIDLMGGKEEFLTKLDAVFTTPSTYDDSYYGFPIHEIKEMVALNMGQYAHGNQPIQHMIYLYNYAGQPWKTQKWIRYVLDSLYKATPDGYCGDEDNGQTSAWYVMSALGFYSVCPGTGQFVFGTPLFPEATLSLENGKQFTITAKNSSAKNIYIQSAKLNGQTYTKTYINYTDMMNGGTLEFQMGENPNKKWGISPNDVPYSMSTELVKENE